MWLERPVAKAVAGSSYRCQADFDMESVRIACSLGGSCVKGPRRLPDIVNLSISNDSCHGKPTTDRSSTSHPKNSLNLQQHRRPSPFLHTTQLSGSSLPRTNRILVSVPTPIQRNRTSCDQTLRLPQVSHPNRQDVEYSRPHVRRPGKTLSGCQIWTGWSLLVPASRFNIPSPPIPMAAVDEPSSPKPTTYLTTAEPIIWLTTTANS